MIQVQRNDYFWCEIRFFFLGKLKSTSYFSLQIGLRLSEFAQAFFPFFLSQGLRLSEFAQVFSLPFSSSIGLRFSEFAQVFSLLISL